MRYVRMSLAALAVVGLLAGGAACDDDTRDKAKEAVESAKEKVGEAGARAAAEAFRASLKAQDDDVPGGVRNVDVLREAAKDLPGDPAITGIDDADGDGRDDDGYVQAKVGDETACVTVPESGDDIDVSGGACPSG
jgi:hypothetical protein